MVEGTNCGNCKFGATRERAKKSELDSQGGFLVPYDAIKRAREADLITLPGRPAVKPTQKLHCDHKEVQQWVTPRMCCAFWDAEGVKRAWE